MIICVNESGIGRRCTCICKRKSKTNKTYDLIFYHLTHPIHLLTRTLFITLIAASVLTVLSDLHHDTLCRNFTGWNLISRIPDYPETISVFQETGQFYIQSEHPCFLSSWFADKYAGRLPRGISRLSCVQTKGEKTSCL